MFLASNSELKSGDKLTVNKNGRWGIIKVGAEDWCLAPEYDYVGVPAGLCSV
jgi:hypothetical protein